MALEKFYKLFLNKLKFSYDSFDRIVLNGYILPFHKATNVLYYFKEILGHHFVNKKLLFSVTESYKGKINELVNRQNVYCEYIDKGKRKEDFVHKYLRIYEKKEKYGIYCILKARENEQSLRIVRPKLKDCDADNYLAPTRKLYTQYYFYIRDKQLGNMCIRVGSYLPFKVTVYLNGHSYIERYLKNSYGRKALYKKRDNAFLNIRDVDKLLEAKEHFTADLISGRVNYWLEIIGPRLEKYPLRYSYFIDQIEYCRNFIFKNHSYLSELFKRSCELSLQLISTDSIRQIFAAKGKDEDISKKLNRIEEGYYVFKAFFKRCSVKQYRKFSNFLRYELTCNNLPDMKLKKALLHLPEFKEKAEEVLDRYSEAEAVMMNCHANADYFIKHSRPVIIGQTKISGLHVYQERINRMLEMLLHDNRSIGQWKSMDIREKILNSFEIPEKEYSRNQVIYDIRKLRAHGIVEKIGKSNRYRLSSYGIKVALAFTLMRKRIYGPIHYSLFKGQPDQNIVCGSKLERLYRRLDSDINEIEDYLAGRHAA
jgi:hypothetical protein